MGSEETHLDRRVEDGNVTVSVIIPTYNCADFLPEALNSVLCQTWRDLEIVVVDDGSTDSTREVVEKYGDRIRYFHKRNEGPSSARNMGIKEARGTYVAFLDSDDLWEPEKLRIQMDFMAEHPDVRLVCTDSRLMGSRGQRHMKLKRDCVGNLFPLLYVKSFVRTSTVLMAGDCFQEIGYFDESYRSAEDYDVWLRVAKRYPIAYLNQPLVRYRKHESNVSHDKITLRHNALRVLKTHYDPKEIPARVFRIRMSDIHLYFGRAYLRLGDMKRARASFTQSMRLTPFRLRCLRYWVKSQLVNTKR